VHRLREEYQIGTSSKDSGFDLTVKGLLERVIGMRWMELDESKQMKVGKDG
jgi:hypothetical protein